MLFCVSGHEDPLHRSTHKIYP